MYYNYFLKIEINCYLSIIKIRKSLKISCKSAKNSLCHNYDYY